MSRIRRSEDFTAWGLQWAGRVISTVFALFLSFMILGDFIEDEHKVTDAEDWKGIVIGIFFLAYLVSAMIAWIQERTGGTLLMILGSIAILAFMATEKPQDYSLTLIIGAPFVVSGLLFRLVAKRIQKKKSRED